ncbi:MAG TPA: OmpA family protein [Pirellulales bacterium]|jgi:flagellar motor protein MotB|nr:OmpA family protein [Pirellulales bacterium]
MRSTVVVSLLALYCLVGSGCANSNPMTAGKLNTLQQQNAMLEARSQELQARAATLDRDNQELETMLAQSRQQTRVYEDQVGALRDQLAGATSQVARLRSEGESTAKRTEALTASVQRRASATIQANNSLQSRLPTIHIPGVEVRMDGDVVRIELPGNQLFEHGSARLLPQASAMIDQVAAELLRSYPDQIIGVEGHTDSDPVNVGSPWASNHQLSIGRAMAVYDHLVSRSHVPSGHLFVVGHGANHPVVSNGALAGKQRNRRVELVVYPDRVSGR